MPLLRFSVTGG